MVENKEEDRSGKTSHNYSTFIVRVKSFFFFILATIWQHMRIIIAPTGFLSHVGPLYPRLFELNG